MTIEPVTPVTPRSVRLAVLAQWWRHVTFVHWPVDPDRAARLLPPTLRPDVVGDVTYVGLVAFRMVRTRVLGLPPVPYLGTFAETNVRLYTVDRRGRRGVRFLSMDASRLVPVVFGRTVLGLPYRWSRMSLAADADRVGYRCQAGGTGPVSRMTVEVGSALPGPTPLELFLTARWGLHHDRGYLGNEHPTWPLHTARLADLDDHLVAAAGLPGVAERPPASVLYSPGVYARFGATRDEPAA